MINNNKIDLTNVSFKLKVESKFYVKGKEYLGVYVCGIISIGKISTNDEIILSDKTGAVKRRSKVIVEIFCSSKMRDKDTAYEPMSIALVLKNTTIDEVEKDDYIVIV